MTDEHVIIDGEPYLCIRDVNRMAPFLMTVVSDSDLWLFIGSNTGFTAGHRNPDRAMFPYQTVDKILDQPKASGALTLMEVEGGLWEPWSALTPMSDITRHLYKHATGTSVRFEETHHGLGLKFIWSMAASEKFGLVRSCVLENLRTHPRRIRLLDGWHRMLPPGVSQETYARFSYLAAAYMRHEAVADCGLGIYTLNSGISDRAEPSESLRVGVAWSLGHQAPVLVLSDRQVEAFRAGKEISPEREVRGEFGAHLLASQIELAAGASHQWTLVTDSDLDHATVVTLRQQLNDPATLTEAVKQDLAATVRALESRIAGADAFQQTADRTASVHHFANVLFNCMRGGTLYDGYHFAASDFAQYLNSRNTTVQQRHQGWLEELPERSTLAVLAASAASINDAQLTRLVREYLPLTFSRRHGDPSRPWNRFDIHTKDPNGKPLLGYSGNWRDIFQNWESLAYSYPACFPSMIAVFLNASTADGYNPYRITRDGIDWEVLDPRDAWSHIGYWGDHQIIYLLRLLEGNERFWPGQLASSLNDRLYVYAQVPYEIVGFDALVHDPRHSIKFDEPLHEQLLARAKTLGGDGKLRSQEDGAVLLVSLAEKLLVPALVKLSNLVPGGGIWLNTQRPEWNDANNALAGWGLSVVTVCYLRRYLNFLTQLLAEAKADSFAMSAPVMALLRALGESLPQASAVQDDAQRWQVTEAFGRAGEVHRNVIYRRQPIGSGEISRAEIQGFLQLALGAVDATIDANRRADGTFHSYNVLEFGQGSAKVHRLDLMLEGQVAALSSGRLTAQEALQVLRAMRQSDLYRADQDSYLLYPNRTITPFLKRNILPADAPTRAPILAQLMQAGDRSLVVQDEMGELHFNADLTNQRDLERQLQHLATSTQWSDGLLKDHSALLELWEEIFHHRAFTGRSGAMFAFEGLGSIYWHMVAKLLLATQEIYCQTGGEYATELADAYEQIRRGLGFTKTARTYGAFPTDPYSHSPGHRGAQQPGMTGQVKEEILTRLGELGVIVQNGQVHFQPTLLKRSEFFTESHAFRSIKLNGEEANWTLSADTLAFTLCQVPVCYVLANEASIQIEWLNSETETICGSVLSPLASNELFLRSNAIRRLVVSISQAQLPPI